MNYLVQIILQIVFWFCLVATAYTYFLYPVVLVILRRWVRMDSSDEGVMCMPKGQLPTVTMVVSAYNEEDVIADKIANCRTLDYPTDKLRFVFGSDGSTDDTNKFLRAAADEQIKVVINEKRGGKVGMLNSLLPMIDSEIVVFSDANTMYEPDAIRELVRGLSRDQVGCVIGKLELHATNDQKSCHTEGLYWRYENKVKQLESSLGAVPTINGGMFAIWRNLFVPLPEHTLTEDQVLGMKIMTTGYRCLFMDKARAQETVSTWSGELCRRIRISAGNFQSLFLVPKILDPRSGWVSFAFISHKLLRWLVPFFLVCLLATNIFLVHRWIYAEVLLAQGLFYLSGFVGALVPNLTGVGKILMIPRYFLAMNLAIMMGLNRFLRGRQKVVWAKAPR
ncbi:MAG: glycosyltransferase family 2 protein [Sedimentisphaerales bacterium]|nr:glycosyltransferase family 2 protein [Sedimentisphaerales bacterium]